MRPENEANLLCRYCGSPDLKRCGFRYNARGISRRYYCHQCERKFAIRIIGSNPPTKVPQELIWLLDEVGLQIARLNDLLKRLDSKIVQSAIEKLDSVP